MPGPATCIVSGTLYDATAAPLPNTVVLFYMAQQVIGGSTIASTTVSTRSDSSGNIAPITLPQLAIVQVTVGQGMVVTGIIPNASSASISQVLQAVGGVITGVNFLTNGVANQLQNTLNLISGTDIVVTNTTGGTVQFVGNTTALLTAHVNQTFPGKSGSPITVANTAAQSVLFSSINIPQAQWTGTSAFRIDAIITVSGILASNSLTFYPIFGKASPPGSELQIVAPVLNNNTVSDVNSINFPQGVGVGISFIISNENNSAVQAIGVWGNIGAEVAGLAWGSTFSTLWSLYRTVPFAVDTTLAGGTNVRMDCQWSGASSGNSVTGLSMTVTRLAY
jgi:hypothetical protein